MKISTYFASTLLVMGLVGGGDAFASSTGSLTFDDLPVFERGLIVDNEYGSKGVTISATSNRSGGNNAAVIFDTADKGLSNDSDLESPFTRTLTGGGTGYWDVDPGITSLDPGNILIVSAKKTIVCGSGFCDIGSTHVADDEAQGGTLTFEFNNSFLFEGFDYFDIEGNEAPLTVDLYDTLGALIVIDGINAAHSLSLPGTNPTSTINTFARIGFNPVDVSKIDFNLVGSGAIDNLQYPVPVPIPAALPMFLFGLAGLGVMARRRKAAAA